jgi:hypothetical protein
MEKGEQGEEPLPLPKGKPTNDIDNALVTLEEKEYNRLRYIERNVKALFLMARDNSAIICFGRAKDVRDKVQEHEVIKELRQLTEMI